MTKNSRAESCNCSQQASEPIPQIYRASISANRLMAVSFSFLTIRSPKTVVEGKNSPTPSDCHGVDRCPCIA